MKRLIFSIVLSLSVFSAMAGVQVVPLPCGEAVMLIATPYSGYKFDSWTDGNTENPRVVSIEQDTIFGANWRECPIKEYAFSKAINKGDSMAFGGRIIKDEGIYKDTLTSVAGCDSIVTLTLSHTSQAKTFQIRVSSADESRGTVSGGGKYKANATATLAATPIGDWVFDKWNDGDTDNPRMIRVNRNANYIAYFTKYLRVNVTVNDPAKGTASYSGINKYGETITCTAIAKSNKYLFSKWRDKDLNFKLSDNSVYSFELIRDINLVAEFKNAPNIVIIDRPTVPSIGSGALVDDPLCVLITDFGGIELVENNAQVIAIYNSAGQLLTTKTNVKQFSMSLVPGVYFIKADNQTAKFIVY